MKKIYFGALALLAMSVTLSAGTIYPANGSLTACASKTTFAALAVPGGGCFVGDKEFTNFTTPLGTLAIPSVWEVNITDQGGDAYRVQVAQAGSVNATNATYPAVFGFQYEVKVIGQENHFITNMSATVDCGGFLPCSLQKQVYDLSGALVASGTLIGGATSTGSPANFTLVPASQWIRVVETLTMNDQKLASFTDNLQQSTVPEPATYAMMGLGLAALGLIARRKKA